LGATFDRSRQREPPRDVPRRRSSADNPHVDVHPRDRWFSAIAKAHLIEK